MSLVWRFNRLRAMSLPEMIYRATQVIVCAFERFDTHRRVPSSDHGSPGRAWSEPLPIGLDATRHTAAADAILAGKFSVLALGATDLGFPPDWNRDPKTGTVAPLAPSWSIDYRSPELVGDIKYLWEPNRHLELVTLAQAWHLTSDERYALGCRTLLDSWFTQCPHLRGLNWRSGLELAIRLINWSFTWHLLGGLSSPVFDGAEGKEFLRRWLDSVYQHCHWISRHFSLYSSANNHLLGEYAGLLVGALTWPLWKKSPRWLKKAQKGLEREALAQNFEDGVNKEQAFWYQHEVADFMLIAALVAQANGHRFSDQYWSRLQDMLGFLASVMDQGGNVPTVGDSDDAIIVRFSQEPDHDVYASLLATGAVLFERGDFKAKAGCVDDKTRWLLGDQAEKRFDALPTQPGRLPVRRAYDQGGYYILGGDFETPQEVRMVADVAPLGYLSIAAHGHADALSFTLSAGGQELLMDPGTYAYHADREWRDYFRGTSAHNTLRVDGADQSVSGGAFLWLRHAEVECEGLEYGTDASGTDAQMLAGSHTGYLRLPSPVRHRRTWVYEPETRTLRITDSLVGDGSHKIELFWHFDPGCVINMKNDGLVARRGTASLALTWPAAMSGTLVRGQVEPPLGWRSRRLDEKERCDTLVVQGTSDGDWQGETLITVSFPERQQRGR